MFGEKKPVKTKLGHLAIKLCKIPTKNLNARNRFYVKCKHTYQLTYDLIKERKTKEIREKKNKEKLHF